MDILRRPLSLPNPRLPQGRKNRLTEEVDTETFWMHQATHELVDQAVGQFPPEKIAHFHEMVDNEAVDFVIRYREDGQCWGYMMNARKPIPDPLYRFTIPLAPDEVYQFDGWVNPQNRGRMVAVIGNNWVWDRRRDEGFEGIVVTVRKKDKPAQRYHQRGGFEPIGEATHWRVGPFRFNRIRMSRPEASVAASASA